MPPPDYPLPDWRAAWIWTSEPTAGTHDYVYFRREFLLETVPGRMLLRLAADRDATLWINGELIAHGPPTSVVKTSESLQVGGFVPFTTVDYPGHLAAVVFCQGCTWRCRYCHNPHLQPFGQAQWKWDDILQLLSERKNFLEAVVFSGGEPTAQAALPDAIRSVRAIGFKAGLHTAGIFPDRLADVLPLVDWVGLDIKAPFDARYDRVTGREGSFEAPAESLRLLLASGVPYELRTTVHPGLLAPTDLEDISRSLDSLGAHPTKIQPFRPHGCTDPELLGEPLAG